MSSTPLTDPARLDALRAADLLDGGSEVAFDRFTRLAAVVLNAPVALVSLVDADRQFFKSCVGLPEPWASTRQTPLSHSFCQHAVTSREPLVVEDARQHPLVKDNHAIRDLGVVAYLGVPLITSGGHALGSFCVIDSQPRRWTEREVGVVRDLTAAVVTEIELRAQTRLARREARDRELAERRLRVEHAVSRALTESSDLADASSRMLDAVREAYGWDWAALWVTDPEARVLRCAETRSVAGFAAGAFEALSRSTALAAGAGLPGRVWETGRPAWIEDVQADANFPRRAAAREAGLHGAFCFPILWDREVVGVMECLAREVQPPDEALLSMLDAVGRQIGQFIRRKQVESEIRRSEVRFAAFVQTALDCIVGMDHEGRVTEWNPAAERTFGYSRAEAMGGEMAALIIPPALRDRHREGLSRYLATGEGPVLGRRFEITAVRKDGTEFPVELTIIRLPGDGPAAFTGYIRDITERRRAEEARRMSEFRWQRLVEQSPLSTQIFAPDGTIRQVNRAWERLWGVTPADLPGYNILQDEQLVQRGMMPLFRRAFAGEPVTIEPIPYTLDRGHHAGHVRWCGAYVYPVKDDAGRVEEVVLVHNDVTEQRLAQEALRASEERLRAVFQQTEAGIAQADLTGRFVLANDRYAQIVGRSRQELLNLRMQDITHPDDLPRNLALFEQAVTDGQPFVIEKRYVRPDGSAVWVSNSVSLMRDHHGKPSGVIAATVDITERKRVEDALRESEQHARRIIDNTLSFIGVMTTDGVLTEANATALRAGGLRREEVVGKKFWDCHWWSYDPRVQERLKDAVARAANGEVVRYDDTVRMAGDTRMPIDFMLSPVRDESGRVTHLIPSGVDIADRVRAEEDVRRSQRQLASVIDNTPSAVFIKDVRGRYLLVNAPFERMAGVPVGTMTGKADIDLFPPDLAASFRDEDERIIGSRDPMTFEESFEFKGEYRTFVTNKFPLRDEAGEVYAVCGIATDVTALKRAERAVRESEQRLRLGLRAGRTGTWDWDITADRVVWSEQVYEFHGLRPDEFGGTREDFAKLIHPEDAERVGAQLQAALNEGKPYEVEFRTVRPTGEVRWLFTTGQVTRDDSGRPVRMMGALIDTTDRKNAEAERERLLEAERVARAEAERASRMKDEFLATLSHELRTPLNAILGWSQLLASGSGGDEDVAEGLRTIERNARAQTQIIEDLLDMSRIISGKVRLDVQRIDLAPVIHGAVETVKPAAEAKGIRLQAVLDPLAGPVSGDPNRLQQVMWNLLNNAIKFTPKGGRVQVVLERVNSHVEINVSDTGEGISPDFLPHVFDRFRQADASTTRRHGGLGLGLAIVKQLVELHGGSIRAASPGVGMGATFSVSLPLSVVHPAPADALPRRHPVAAAPGVVNPEMCLSLARVRVLVVDDEADARNLVRRLLENCDAIVTTAGSASEGMRVMQAERPDVLVSDIGMPDEDGYAFIRQVRALGPERGGDVPAVALTAYARSEDRMRSVLAGFQMHVAKPVEPAELITMVASLAGRTR